jgi:hypothetical protein
VDSTNGNGVSLDFGTAFDRSKRAHGALLGATGSLLPVMRQNYSRSFLSPSLADKPPVAPRTQGHEKSLLNTFGNGRQSLDQSEGRKSPPQWRLVTKATTANRRWAYYKTTE